MRTYISSSEIDSRENQQGNSRNMFKQMEVTGLELRGRLPHLAFKGTGVQIPTNPTNPHQQLRLS